MTKKKKAKRNDGLNVKMEKQPIVEKCNGCSKECDGECAIYADPSFHWEEGKVCSFASHVKRETTKVLKKKVNPLKASKRAAKKRAKRNNKKRR